MHEHVQPTNAARYAPGTFGQVFAIKNGALIRDNKRQDILFKINITCLLDLKHKLVFRVLYYSMCCCPQHRHLCAC